jgi:hypothetical protein
MRQKVTSPTLELLMKALGAAVKTEGRVYLVGGATAVLVGWRESTIDVDLKIVPDNEIPKSISDLKERLQVNIELASPDDFIPMLPGWQDRSAFIRREGRLDFFHYDFYAQALAKIERGHKTDLADVQELIVRGLIQPARLLEFFSQIEDRLYKYPAIDKDSFQRAVRRVVSEHATEKP